MQRKTTQTINRQIGYTVREITTETTDLKCWTENCDEEDLINTATTEGYTYIPVKQNDVITGILKLQSLTDGNRNVEPLTSNWLIASDTPILHFLELLADNPNQHYFVLSSSQIIGMVSPADLNRIPARASFYLLVAHFETLLTELIRHKIGETVEVLGIYLSDGRMTRAIETRDQERDEDIELPILHYIQLFDLVEIIANHDDLRAKLGFESKKAVRRTIKFADIRNPVAHLNNMLIKSRNDIQDINKDCSQIIQYSKRITDLLSAKSSNSES